MLLIVAHHYVVNSGLIGAMKQAPLSADSVFLYIFGAWGKMGINCFVLITGYFMCRSSISVSKALKLLLQVLFYSISIYLIFVACGLQDFSLTKFAKACLPIKGLHHNFTSCFIAFFFCIPFLNILVQNMSKSLHLLLLIFVLALYTIQAALFGVTFNYVTWFCILYFISSYIRLHGFLPAWGWKQWGFASLGLLLLSSASIPLLLSLGISPYRLLVDCNAPLAIATAIALFMCFKGMPLPQSRFINSVAACTFGVLLIHAHSDTMRQWLWKDTLDNAGQYGTETLYLHAFGSVLAVFTICAAIDYLRIILLEKPLFSRINSHLARKGWK